MSAKLQTWVDIGNLVASAGVVISILFVGYELNSGNKIRQAENDNLIYELMDSLYSDLSTTPELIQAETKLWNGLELTPNEETHHNWRLWRHMNLWELAFDRHREGFVSDQKWQTWDRAFRTEIIDQPTAMPEETWKVGRLTYGDDFIAYVDSIYASRRN